MNLADRLIFADELTTYYCRHRHNVWSGEWIRANLSNDSLSNYSGWVQDLILLCQSHHFGYDKLTRNEFSTRWVGSPSEAVNLRFLALVLRIADILEFDPERTPEVILRHRDISSRSQIYWWKDKDTSLAMIDGKIVVTARPSSARIHRAMEETIRAIDVELVLCRRIADENLLRSVPGASKLQPYEWTLPAAVHSDVTPREDTYEYIDGAFRPDTKKLLSILSGTSLYQTPLHAVRELLQNAFDAVAEKIAYQRLSQPNPASATLAANLAKQHRVSLQLETDGADAYLVCVDNGIGMTKAVIRDRVLVSGSGPRHDVRSLEKRCNEAGFRLGRSGQFGIGILSYFMIATNVEIETLRAQEAGDSDSTIWRFSTEGIGSFGELRRLGGSRPGTQVRLRLTSVISSDLTDWYISLRYYLERILVRCPCEFHLNSSLPGCEPLTLDPGWSLRNYSEVALEGLRKRDDSRESQNLHLLSSAERGRRLDVARETADLEKDFGHSIRWRWQDGTLSDHSAEYVIGFPYFELEGGVSLAFLQPSKSPSGKLMILRFLNGTHFRPRRLVEEAWKGMAVGRHHGHGGQFSPMPSLFFRLNWVSDAEHKIMANRDEFVTGNTNLREKIEIEAVCRELLDTFLDEYKDSQYAWLNERLAGSSRSNTKASSWLKYPIKDDLLDGENAELAWDKINFPAISRSSLGYIFPDSRSGGYVFNEKSLEIIPWSVPAAQASMTELGAIGWNSASVAPDRIAYMGQYADHRFGMVPIWLKQPRQNASLESLESKFAPEWHELCGARFDWYGGHSLPAVVWNGSNRLVQQVTSASREWCEMTFQTLIDPIPHRVNLLSDPALAASWILRCISGDEGEIWNGLPERDPQLLPELFRIAFASRKSNNVQILLFWIGTPGNDSRLRVITPQRWTTARDSAEIKKYLPIPASAWKITENESAKSKSY
jgi:hypothetical protein